MPDRQITRAQRQAAYWAQQAAAASNPAARCAVSWEHLRATISKLPDERQPAVWAAVTKHLNQIQKHFEPEAQPRRRRRGSAPSRRAVGSRPARSGR
ncbi:hypothetical protein ACWD4B_13365 [Streptomyces sp. NPDC002536]|uniref:hypothetical protein n=1 Tax=Streptomyces sp. NPDC001262 TaxID=3364552 RepID=UPI0036A26DCB